MRDHGRSLVAPDIEHQPRACDAEAEREWAGIFVSDRRKQVLFDQVVDRNLPLVFDVRVGAADRFLVESNADEPLFGGWMRLLAH